MKINNIVGSAGRIGDNIRSDCFTEVKLTSKGGIKINIRSKVELLYGKALRGQITELAKFFNLKNAEITLSDKGALPFAIDARFEAAVKRADNSIEKSFVIKTKKYRDKNQKDRLRRTRLYIPGNEPHFFINAHLHKPDCIILDLEDSVAPSEKDAARFLVRNALQNVNFGSAERMVRINQLPEGLKDLEQITENVQTILVPKCESAEQLKQIVEYLNQLSAKNKQAENIFLIPIIESALGIVNAYEIASSSRRICAIAIGLEDYAADIGAERTKAGTESLFARCAIINAAKAAGVQALDSVFSDLNDDKGLAASTSEAKALGFDGKGCIHPKQIKIIHNGFSPTEKEIEYAATIITAYEDAVKNGSGVISIGSKMIDPPVIKRAQKILKVAASSKKRS